MSNLDIIIVTENRFDLIEKCIASLGRASEGRGFRLLVGFNGSPSDYVKSVSEILSRYRNTFEVHSVEFTRRHPGSARNEVLALAKAEWIFFCDDDVVVPEDLFKNFIELQAHNPKVNIFGGPNLSPENSTPIERAQGHALSSTWICGPMAARYAIKKQKVAFGSASLTLCNLFWRRQSSFYFPKNFFCGEELKMIAGTRGPFLTSEKLVVMHYRRPQWNLFLKQTYKYGYGRAQMMPVISVMSWSLFFLIAVLLSVQPTLGIASVLIYLLYLLLVSTQLTLNYTEKWSALPSIVTAAAIIHCGYYFGLMTGWMGKKMMTRWTWLILVGVGLRLVAAVWPNSLWSDEQATLFFSQIPFREAIARDNSAPLFMLLMRAWVQWVPLQEQWLRLLPFLISSITLIYVFKRWQDPLVRLFWVINPASISFAGEVKNTALFEFMSVLFIGEWFRLLENAREKGKISNSNFWPLAVLTMALVSAHYLGILLIVSVVVVAVIKIPNEFGRRNLTIKVLAVTIILFLIYHFCIHWGPLNWMVVQYHSSDPFIAFAKIILTLGSYSRFWAVALMLIVGWEYWKNKSIEALWFLIAVVIFGVGESVAEMSLSVTRFLVPLQILLLFASAKGFKSLLHSRAKSLAQIVLIVGILLQGKKIIENINTAKSGWKEASTHLCNNTIKDPIFVFGHESTKFYFPADCAKIVTHWTSSTSKKSLWVAKKQSSTYLLMLAGNAVPKVRIQQIQEFEPHSNEPILIYEAIQN